MSVTDLRAEIEKEEVGSHVPSHSLAELGLALKQFGRGDDLNAKSIGRWFKRNLGVVVGGRHFERVACAGASFRYRLVCAGNA